MIQEKIGIKWIMLSNHKDYLVVWRDRDLQKRFIDFRFSKYSIL